MIPYSNDESSEFPFTVLFGTGGGSPGGGSAGGVVGGRRRKHSPARPER